MKDDKWSEAVAGCRFVLHIASPFPDRTPKEADELIIPAREGTLRVLRAARKAGVERVVLTSSFAAVGYSIPPEDHVFTKDDWTDPVSALPAYIKSKTIAEKAAWQFANTEGGHLALSVINPVGIFGPVLGDDFSSSIQIIRRMMSGEMPLVPDVYTNVVDVRDAADLHILAMTGPGASGQRFIALAESNIGFLQMAAIIREGIPAVATRISVKKAPGWLLKVMALFKPELKQVIPQLGVIRQASNAKAREVLGWQPRSIEETILATAQSLLDKGIVKPV